MKNPYYINFIWLGIIVCVLGFMLFYPCCYCDGYCFLFPSRMENVLIGIFSSAILLLFVEIIQFINDRVKYGFLAGTFIRKLITQMNDQGLRSSEVPQNIVEPNLKEIARKESEIKQGVKFFNPDSRYCELVYYRCDEMKYEIHLHYKFHGIYTGTVEYFDHDKSPQGNWKERVILKTKANVTLNLNLANKQVGSGSYKYQSKNDYGKLDFQVNNETNNEIVVSYKNTIPTGMAEGYEIWERVNK